MCYWKFFEIILFFMILTVFILLVFLCRLHLQLNFAWIAHCLPWLTNGVHLRTLNFALMPIHLLFLTEMSILPFYFQILYIVISFESGIVNPGKTLIVGVTFQSDDIIIMNPKRFLGIFTRAVIRHFWRPDMKTCFRCHCIRSKITNENKIHCNCMIMYVIM